MRNLILTFIAAAMLAACSTTDDIKLASSTTYGIKISADDRNVPYIILGNEAVDYASVPGVRADGTVDGGAYDALRMRNVCGEEDIISVYATLDGNIQANAGPGANVAMNTGRSIALGPAAKYQWMTAAASVSPENAAAIIHEFYSCDRTLMDEKEYRQGTGAAPPSGEIQ
jgi:hypothetical protein